SWRGGREGRKRPRTGQDRRCYGSSDPEWRKTTKHSESRERKRLHVRLARSEALGPRGKQSSRRQHSAKSAADRMGDIQMVHRCGPVFDCIRGAVNWRADLAAHKSQKGGKGT